VASQDEPQSTKLEKDAPNRLPAVDSSQEYDRPSFIRRPFCAVMATGSHEQGGVVFNAGRWEGRKLATL
jgi:hypothetical protein